jgi:hypothetical protein
VAPLTTLPHAIAYPDTAATGHFVPLNCPGTAITHAPLEVQCANKTHMQSVATVVLYIPSLPANLKTATVFQEMTKPLLSIPTVCDGGMESESQSYESTSRTSRMNCRVVADRTIRSLIDKLVNQHQISNWNLFYSPNGRVMKFYDLTKIGRTK